MLDRNGTTHGKSHRNWVFIVSQGRRGIVVSHSQFALVTTITSQMSLPLLHRVLMQVNNESTMNMGRKAPKKQASSHVESRPYMDHVKSESKLRSKIRPNIPALNPQPRTPKLNSQSFKPFWETIPATSCRLDEISS